MDWELLTIFLFVIVITSIVGGTVNGIVSKVIDYKKSERAHSTVGKARKQDVSNLTERTEMIEDRLKVLERLATDRGTLLADEIEALRDSATALPPVKTRPVTTGPVTTEVEKGTEA